jgi:glycosyltransferase involved in cell wall biosynthesis
MKQMDISVVVPAFQKESSIASDLWQLDKVLQKTNRLYEIVCVVNGSSDKTYEIAKKTSMRIKNLKVLNIEKSCGKGYAVRTGFKHCSGKVICFIDSGGKISPKVLPNMISLVLSGYDGVIGSKFLKTSRVNFSFHRSVYSRGFKLLVKFLFGLPYSDTQVGVKSFSRKLINIVLPKLKSDGYAFDVELLAVSKRYGFLKIVEVPVDINFKTGSSYSSNPLSILNMIIDLLKIYFNQWT